MLTKKKDAKRKLPVKAIGGILLSAFAIGALATIADPASAARSFGIAYSGKYTADFADLAETKAAADELNVEISAEGDVLLKNDGTLPFDGSEKISVFGGAQDGMVGATGSMSVPAALAEVGFKVNPTVKAYYDATKNTIGAENVSDVEKLSNSYKLYNDAAVIVLSRTGGEGADLNTVTTEIEDNKDGNGEDYDWNHAALSRDSEDKEHKHYLQLTDSEEALIAHVKANFKKIVVVVNTSNAMEMANLQNDPAINGIIWIGRPGSTGIKALAKILNGEINPSGRLVDEWMKDFTLDPTWQNFGVNKQVGTTNLYDYDYENITGAPKPGTGNSMVGGDGYYGIDYDESIYLGYKYYETVYAELKADSTIRYDAATKKIVKKSAVTGAYDAATAADEWWENAVVYPFGYGLSYTSFTQTMGEVYYKLGGVKTTLGASVNADLFNSSKGHAAQVEKLYVPVTVTNTGSVAGKQVVQVYVTAPYTANGIEKAAVNLVGFAKTSKLRPGQSETVTVEVNVQDMASFDYDDKNHNDARVYELDEGSYELKVMTDSHRVSATKSFDLVGTATLAIDDFSHNDVKPVFSNDDTFDTVRKNKATGESDKFLDVTKTDEGEQKLLSRTDFSVVDAQGLVITDAERALSDEFVKSIVFWTNYTTDNQDLYADDGCSYFLDALAPTGHYSWYKTNEELASLMTGWTQAAAHEKDNSDVTVKLRDMAGIEFDDPKWTTFMNQLTWSDMQTLINSAMRSTKAITAIDKSATSDPNGPNDFGGKYWCDETVVSSTWNVNLGEQYGIINGNIAMFSGYGGWYGPGINCHRSPFGGRNNEYFSQDGYQGGAMAAAVVGGAQSRGVNVWAKHMFMNDQEENRSRQCLFTWADEQAIREIYGKQFQMALQEGNCSASMIAYNRVGGIVACANYNFLQRLVRDEWGWEGEYVTDYYGNNAIQTNSMDLMVRCGGNLPDGTASGSKALRGTWDAEANTIKIGSGENIVESPTEWYYGRIAAQRSLFVAANTLNNKNGVDLSGFTAKTIDATQGVAVNEALGLPGTTANYEISAGELPEGLSLNASTGAITGTSKALPGTYSVTVKATVDGWITSSAKITINLASAFTLNAEAAAEVGKEYTAFIESEVVTASKYTKGITYSVVDGELPAGLELDGDAITGTPTAPGTYKATIEVKGSYTSGRNTVTDTYHTQVTITVTGEAVTPVEPEEGKTITSVETIEGGYRINFSDGTHIDVMNGEKGEKGDKGDKGDTGEKGDKGDAGEGGSGTSGKTITSVEPTDNGYTITFSDGTSITITNGADGAKGEKGDKGDTGATGATGATGPQGPQGPQGPAGEAGAAEEGGCGGSIIASGSVVLTLAAAAVAVALKSKKEEK